MEFQAVDLQGCRLDDFQLDGISFEQSNLTSAKFYHCSAKQSNFAEADLSDSIFHDCNFEGASFSSAYLSETDLGGCNLTCADFSRSNGKAASFRNANFSKATFAHANLQNAVFDGGKGEHSDFSNADLSEASLIGASLQYSNFENSQLLNASCWCANLFATHWKGASFSNLVLGFNMISPASDFRGQFDSEKVFRIGPTFTPDGNPSRGVFVFCNHINHSLSALVLDSLQQMGTESWCLDEQTALMVLKHWHQIPLHFQDFPCIITGNEDWKPRMLCDAVLEKIEFSETKFPMLIGNTDFDFDGFIALRPKLSMALQYRLHEDEKVNCNTIRAYIEKGSIASDSLKP